jgi:hypothetical protein
VVGLLAHSGPHVFGFLVGAVVVLVVVTIWEQVRKRRSDAAAQGNDQEVGRK